MVSIYLFWIGSFDQLLQHPFIPTASCWWKNFRTGDANSMIAFSRGSHYEFQRSTPIMPKSRSARKRVDSSGYVYFYLERWGYWLIRLSVWLFYLCYYSSAFHCFRCGRRITMLWKSVGIEYSVLANGRNLLFLVQFPSMNRNHQSFKPVFVRFPSMWWNSLRSVFMKTFVSKNREFAS